MSAYLVGLKCPICGESVHLSVKLSGKYYAGNYWNPPEHPDVEWDVKEAEFECVCTENIESFAPKANTPKRRRLKTEPLFPGSEVVMIIEEHQRDDEGKLVYIDSTPLLEAYFDALDELAQECSYHFDPDDL